MLFFAGTQIVSAYNSYQVTVRDGLKGLRDRGDAFTRTFEACMRAAHERGALSAEWLQDVSEDLIVAWGEPRAVLIEADDGVMIANAGDMSLRANATDGRLTVGGKELFVYSSAVRLSGPANGQSIAASSSVDVE